MSTSRFLLGAAIGVAVGLLIAPKKGEELRDEITDTATEWRDKFNRLLGRAGARVEDLKNLLTDEIDGLSEDVRHRILTILDEASEMAYNPNNSYSHSSGAL
ncbi:MAG: YtxH domain-containing protein [Taibaiella sp.]|nr:YtxH domain-containing protein [Taibaiella sp.]